MTDELNRAIRQAAGKPKATHKVEPMARDAEELARQREERWQSAVMNRALRAAAGVPDESEPPVTGGNSAKEDQ